MNKVSKVLLIAALVVGFIFVPKNSVSSTENSGTQLITISKNNTIVLNSEINGESVAAVISKAKELDAGLGGVKEKITGKRPLYLFLFSPGGSIQAGLELIEALKGLGRPVHTITLFAASMAFQLVQQLDDRYILRYGVLMSHHAMGQAEGEFGGSVKSQMENRQQLWLDRVKELDEQTVKRTNGKQSYESYTKQYDHEMWLTGSVSTEQGYADKIVAVKCDPSLTGVTTHHVNFMGLDIAYDLDNCPLNTGAMNARVGLANANDKVSSATEEAIKQQFIVHYTNMTKRPLPMNW